MRPGHELNVLYFNEAGSHAPPNAYGTLKTRVLHLELNSVFDCELRFDEMTNVLLDRWGFDMTDLLEITYDWPAKRIEFRQKWWDRSEREPNIDPNGVLANE